MAMVQKVRASARILIAGLALATAVSLGMSWRAQSIAKLTCVSLFEPRHEHNGYLQINILGPHPTESIFEGEVFAYYPSYQKPERELRIERMAIGSYARSTLTTELVPFSSGLATPQALKFDLPTGGTSQRDFPFDSPSFDLVMALRPAIRPGGVLIRNMSADFVLQCSSVTADWNGTDQLRVRFKATRNPFVRTTIVIIALAALTFAGLLSLIGSTEDLAVATASYFFSVWSIRGIVTPSGLNYSSLLDLWLMGTCLMALFVVAWRLTGTRRAS